MNRLRQYRQPFLISLLVAVFVVIPNVVFAVDPVTEFFQKILWSILTTITGTILWICAMLFDFSVNKHEPIGETRVTKKSRLTKISFHPVEPIILVSDDSGIVICLKLSPNMRKPLPKGEVSLFPDDGVLSLLILLFCIPALQRSKRNRQTRKGPNSQRGAL